MPKKSIYRDPQPGTLIGDMRTAVFNLLQEHVADGTIPTSARFLYYELVMRGVCSKEMPEGDNRSPQALMNGALTHLRKRGYVPWEYIVDETRSLENLTGASNLKLYLDSILEQARIDPWEGDPPLVLTESRSLAGAKQPNDHERAPI